MKKSTIYGILWSGWLGYWLSKLGADLTTWQFWVIIIPIIILIRLEARAECNDN